MSNPRLHPKDSDENEKLAFTNDEVCKKNFKLIANKQFLFSGTNNQSSQRRMFTFGYTAFMNNTEFACQSTLFGRIKNKIATDEIKKEPIQAKQTNTIDEIVGLMRYPG